MITKSLEKNATRSTVLAFLSAVLCLCPIGCDDEPTIEPDPSPPATDTGVGFDGGKDVDTGRVGCPELPGPEMVEVTAPNDATYCIDSTEVTQAQYFEFIKAKGGVPSGLGGADMSGQPPECSENMHWGPRPYEEGDCSAYAPAYDIDEKHPDYPVACVDWCDAYAYCSWAGKRLCGMIGGGATAISEVANAQVDQWYNACSQGGHTKYSFGDTYTEGVCPMQNEAVTVEGCSAENPPYSAIQRLSGGLGEWVDACEKGRNGNLICRVRGGCYVGAVDMATETTCDCEKLGDSRDRFHTVGFRCCLD